MEMNNQKYVLGLDLGSNSLGWAAIALNSENSPEKILGLGVRVFNPGMKDLEGSNPKTPASERREARLMRRLLDRKRRRKLKVFYLLREKGLIPNDKNRVEFIKEIDKEAISKYKNEFSNSGFSPDVLHHIIPYYLRARALNHKLDKEELARVFYHLAQRRGFLSTRKELKKKDDYGKVKKGITELHKQITDSGSRTVGEYFSRVNPMEQRIRNRYTSRDMSIDEFNKIFEKQKEFYPDILNENFKKELYDALFSQRPLKSVRHLVGMCEYEKNSKRCPWYRVEAQQFRILQDLNNIRIFERDKGIRRELSDEERSKLFEYLDRNDEISFSRIKEILELKNIKINFEEGGRNKIKGNKTNFEMAKIFGERWYSFNESEREEVYHDLNSIQDIERLKKIARKKWGLDEDKALLFSEVVLEDGYCNLSFKALKKILPHMKEGLTYPEAIEKVYESFHQKKNICEKLPMVDSIMKGVTNPLVKRCLTEVRHTVNALIKKFGKPYEIHIELARELKSTKDEKVSMQKRMKENEKENEEAKEFLKNNFNILNPSREDIIKYKLWKECRYRCPYTGKSISAEALFGPNPEFDIEHIIPLSRSLDDSFANKTLCYIPENRSVKKNKTPYEAYSSDPEKYEEIKNRVKSFTGKFKDEKYRRFILTDTTEFEDFTKRYLNDTRYASKLAMEYVAHLYGGVWDENGNRKIFAVSGPITAYIRRFYGMSRALGGEIKNRDDHRHHAIDACAIALVNNSTVKKLSEYAKNNWEHGRTAIKNPSEPWEGFNQEIKEKINSVITFHHVGKKVRGKLHEESFYGKTEKEGYVKIRKPLESLSKSQVEDIKDDKIRVMVKDILKKNGDKKPSKVFSNPDNLPFIEGKDGIKVRIHSATIETKLKTFPVGKNERLRYVASNSNHHMEIVAVLDEKGNEKKWEGHVVSMFEAYQRKKNKEPIVKRDFGPQKKFKFSLNVGSIISLDGNIKGREFKGIYVIRCIPESLQIFFVKVNDARKQIDIKQTKQWYSLKPNELRKYNCKKLFLTPLGEVRYAND